jgi:hypothetical protein
MQATRNLMRNFGNSTQMTNSNIISSTRIAAIVAVGLFTAMTTTGAMAHGGGGGGGHMGPVPMMSSQPAKMFMSNHALMNSARAAPTVKSSGAKMADRSSERRSSSRSHETASTSKTQQTASASKTTPTANAAASKTEAAATPAVEPATIKMASLVATPAGENKADPLGPSQGLINAPPKYTPPAQHCALKCGENAYVTMGKAIGRYGETAGVDAYKAGAWVANGAGSVVKSVGSFIGGLF